MALITLTADMLLDRLGGFRITAVPLPDNKHQIWVREPTLNERYELEERLIESGITSLEVTELAERVRILREKGEAIPDADRRQNNQNERKLVDFARWVIAAMAVQGETDSTPLFSDIETGIERLAKNDWVVDIVNDVITALGITEEETEDPNPEMGNPPSSGNPSAPMNGSDATLPMPLASSTLTPSEN